MSQDGGSGRRKSFAFFSRPSILSEETSALPMKEPLSIKTRPMSVFFGGKEAGIPHDTIASLSNSSPTRPKILTKSQPSRPRSVFGSLKNREPASPMAESSASSSIETSSVSESVQAVKPISNVVVKAGEVVTSGGLLRKKKEYVVLTNCELLRYKSEHKAQEAFGYPRRLSINGRAPSVASIGDMGGEHTLVSMMNQVVAVYGASPGSDNDIGCVVQVDYLDDVNGTPSSTLLQVGSSEEAYSWAESLRMVSGQCRASSPPPDLQDSVIQYIARRLEAEKDYSPTNLQIFRVIQRAGKSSSKSGSSEDLHKMYSTLCYLAIGAHKIHMVPVPKSTSHRSSGSHPSTATTSCYGILNLAGLWISDFDDCFALTFRFPCRPPQKVLLASADAPVIIQCIRQVMDYLRPEWHIPPFLVNIPEGMKDEAIPAIPPTPGDDLNGFHRTLAAYCASYNLDASNIVYGVQIEAEEGPQFVLYPPAYSRRRQYTDLELLAIMRSLRWNECFQSISFRGISLDPLDKVYDAYGIEYEPRCERSGRPINLKTTPGNKSLLIHELRALALYSGKLRRMDFFECIRRRSRAAPDGPSDGSCSIVEAIMPLCRRGLTNVDSFVMTGIELQESDLDWLVDAAASRLAHFRGFELARCGLTERMITLFLNALITHENTLETLDLSGNPGRIHVTSLNNTMSYFPFLRKLNLSRMLRTSGDDALLTAETLLRWRLEDLDLSETNLNSQTVDAVATYLASPQSESLHHLALTQCGLTSEDVAVFLHSMGLSNGRPRDMHLYIGRNPLARYHDKFVECIANGITPTHLTVRMVDYPKEEMFQELARALAVNTSLVYLDISKVSLPYEAGAQTCKDLATLFAQNKTLKELDISGEQAVLESARLGAGLANALGALADNTTLEVLRIELQSLGTPGAMELASVLAKNTTLRELYCEMNDIHLQGFTAIVNAIENNNCITYIPRMDRDRAEHVRHIKEKLFMATDAVDSKDSMAKDLKRGIRKTSAKSERDKKTALTDEALNVVGVEQNMMILEEKWESEVQRLEKFLARNNSLQHERFLSQRIGSSTT